MHKTAKKNFATKIDLAFSIDLIDEDLRKELHTIREVRNIFAHTLGEQRFGSQGIRHLCNNLEYSDDQAIKFEIPSEIADFGAFLLPKPDPVKPLSPRQRFTRACEFIIGALALLRQERPNARDR
jgi:hypothetical protein